MNGDPRTSRRARPAVVEGRHRASWRRVISLVRQCGYDARRFAVHSGAVSPRAMASLGALITMDTHRIEKGLAVAEPRPWFGRSIVRRLLANTAAYLNLGGDPETCQPVVAALTEYLHRNSHQPEPAPRWVECLPVDLAELADRMPETVSPEATRLISRESILAARLDSLDFFSTRHSIRQFHEDPVPWDDIRKAVEAAQTTPSVCNRQSPVVYVFPRGEAANKVLALQNGNAGFGNTASHVLVVTVDLRTFVHIGERNQGWIDGGMFAMSLIYALHALGVGTCCLNWSVDHRTDRRLRSVMAVPDHESVIMMLAIGRIPETLPVTASRRRPTDEVLRQGRLRASIGIADEDEYQAQPHIGQEEPCPSIS
jgi:nitroreductase